MILFEAVTGLPHLHLTNQPCGGCQLRKSARTKMPKQTTHHTSKPLELVHSDVCGPFRVNSLGGCRYFVTFIDDFSKRIWIYFIKNKSEVLSKFQHFVHLLKTMTGRTVQALRTDNGGEYTSKDFAEFCLSQGISRGTTTTLHPGTQRRRRTAKPITTGHHQMSSS